MSTAVADPQTSVDDEVRQHQHGQVDAHAAADRFVAWAAAAQVTAQSRASRGDTFGALLAGARAEVYLKAARIMGLPPAQRTVGLSADDVAWLHAEGWRPGGGVGVVLMRHAMRSAVSTETGWTLRAWDENGARYVRARAWQLCAWHLDPTLPEVQREWS